VRLYSNTRLQPQEFNAAPTIDQANKGGITALMFAMVNGHVHVAKLLLRAGAMDMPALVVLIKLHPLNTLVASIRNFCNAP
jgi:ankyrin repeat protein